MTAHEPVMAEPLYHIALRTDWEAAQPAGRYEVSTRGVSLAAEGFIHCSLRHQVRGIAEACYADLDDLVLLVIDPASLGVPVRYEPAVPGGEAYPHIYGALPVHAVVHVHPVTRDASGQLVLPS
jgi:uncharacterized protein (DUF952 family)